MRAAVRRPEASATLAGGGSVWAARRSCTGRGCRAACAVGCGAGGRVAGGSAVGRCGAGTASCVGTRAAAVVAAAAERRPPPLCCTGARPDSGCSTTSTSSRLQNARKETMN